MSNATTLTRQGRLTEATRAIQEALSQSASYNAEVPGGHRSPSPQPASIERTLADTASRRYINSETTEDIAYDGLTSKPPLTPFHVRREQRKHVPGKQKKFSSGEFTHAGISVPYRLYIPSTSSSANMPLLVLLHGCTQDATDFATGTDMNSVAEENGIAVLYPSQTSRGNANKCWNWFEPAHQRRGSGEPAALSALTRQICSDHAFDLNQVFVAGMSAGGAMAVVLGEQYPELFAAVGIHSGLPSGVATNMMQALSAMKGGNDPLMRQHTHMPGMTGATASTPVQTSARAQPCIIFHGEMDRTVDAANARAIVTNCLQRASGINDCITSECKKTTSGSGAITVTTYRDTTQRVLCENWCLHSAGHRWSGGNLAGTHTDATGPNASAEMVRFFLASAKEC